MEGLSANPKEMLVWKQIVLNGDALTIFTKNHGNPLCLCNVTIDSRLSVLKPLKTDSLRGGPGADGEDARKPHLMRGLAMQGPCTVPNTLRLQVLEDGSVINMGLEGTRALQNQPSFPDLCLSDWKLVHFQAVYQCLLQACL